MRLKKLSNQFLLNYIVIFALIITLGISAYYIYNTYNYWLQDNYIIDLEQLENDYNISGLGYARDQQAFTEEDYIMVLGPDRTILEISNAPFDAGKNFSEIELQELLYGDDYYNFMAFYNQDKTRLFITYTVYVETGFTYIATIIAITGLLFAFITILFAKYTSNQILRPILTLVKGVKKITHGDYDVHMTFDASNELNSLKDEINTMTQTLKMETERRAQLEDNRKQLLRDISHDIRTPLTNILGYSDQLMRANNFTSETQKQSIEIINQYGLRANTLISELFDLSRYEIEKDALEMKEIDFVEFTRLKVIDYINEFEKRNIHVDIQLLDKQLILPINIIGMQRVFDNLLQNTLKYNNDNFSLTLHIKEKDTTYSLMIADNGIGIPEAYQTSIFEPMVRVENSRNRAFGGTGLGLAIVKQIINKHGWSIALSKPSDNYYNQGCTFIITIPKLNGCP